MEVLIDAQAGPGVDGGIALLCLGELGGFPVRELLPLADLLMEKDGEDLLEAHVGDAVLFDHLLQLDESSRMQIAHPGKLMEVVGGGEAHLDAMGVLKEMLEG